MIRWAIFLTLCLASGASALDLPSNARMTAERVSQSDSYAAPTGVFAAGAIPVLDIEGVVRRQAWQITSPGLTPLQVLEPLRDQLLESGFQVVLDCADRTCGGFDFRFGTEVLPAPNMYVNIADYRFLTAFLGPVNAPEAVTTLLVSSTRDAAYLQIVEARRDGTGLRQIAAKGAPASLAVAPNPPAEVVDVSSLLDRGFWVMDGLAFSSGSTQLGSGEFAALAALSSYLKKYPELRIALVGHTDSVGALAGNINLSRQRAQAVRRRLIEDYGITPERVGAEGMGYLAPRASNLTEEGRTLNRRVEVIVIGRDVKDEDG